METSRHGSRPTPRPTSPLTLRRDVRLVVRGEHLYVCASTGTLRVPVRLPGADGEPGPGVNELGVNELGVNGSSVNGSSVKGPGVNGAGAAYRPGDEHGLVALDAVPERVGEGLRARGLAHHGDGRLPHPLYGNVAALRGRTVAVAGDGPLATEVATLLDRTGVRPVPADGAGEPDAAVLPLGLHEDELRRWTGLAADAGTPLVTFLSTPTRLLLATLTPPRTPCPVCLVRRIRANHTWQQVAGLPLDLLLGAAESEAWPTTAVAAGVVAHEVLTTLSAPPARTAPEAPALHSGLPVLTELDHASLERTRHALFHTPGCPACGSAAVPPRRDEAAAVDVRESWRLMRGAVDPLTGLVPELRVDRAAEEETGGVGPAGGTTYARTAGMITTTWFSPVAAEARGGAVKSDPVNARVCAVGETLERYAAGVYDPGRFVRATLKALGEEAVDPRSLPLGSAKEYAEQRRYAPFDPDVEIDWVRGRSLTTGRARYVPACAVHLPYRFPRAHKPWFDPISTGLAAGGSYHHAVHGGLMEVVERDATLVFWENRLTLPSLDLTGLPDGPARRIVERITGEGATVTAKDLTTDLGIPAVAVRFVEGTAERPVVIHAARADLDPRAALLGALEEACLCRTGAGIWLEEAEIPAADAALSSLSEFCLYYCAPERQHHLDFWNDGPLRPVPEARPAGALQDDVAEAVRRLADRGYETITVDITPIDVAECGVSVVRTVIPGLCPLTLRSDFHRRGGPRVFTAPVAMGARDSALTEDQLNPMPLPFL